MNIDKLVIPDSKEVISCMENALIVKSLISNLLQGKNSLEQSIVITAPDETFKILKVK